MIVCPVCHSTDVVIQSQWKEFTIVLCNWCNVEFAHPMKSPGKEWYEQHLLYKHRYQSIGQYVGWMHREFLKSVKGKGQKLIDLGCGTGDFVMEARKHGFDAVGLDFDAEAIGAGRAYWKTDHLHCESIEHYVETNKTNEIEIITFYEVLEHLENPGAFLAMVHTILRPGGLISFSVPNRDSPLNRLHRKLVPAIDNPPHHLTRWSKKAIRVALQKYGYVIEAMTAVKPSLADQVPDALRVRFSWIPVKIRSLISLSFSLLLLPIDKFLLPLFVQEGRGLVVIAKKV